MEIDVFWFNNCHVKRMVRSSIFARTKKVSIRFRVHDFVQQARFFRGGWLSISKVAPPLSRPLWPILVRGSGEKKSPQWRRRCRHCGGQWADCDSGPRIGVEMALLRFDPFTTIYCAMVYYVVVTCTSRVRDTNARKPSCRMSERKKGNVYYLITPLGFQLWSHIMRIKIILGNRSFQRKVSYIRT